MVDTQALAKLRDIQLPEPIGWWPMAPGWYVLSVLALFCLILIAYCLNRYYANSRCKREALLLLVSYEQEYRRTGNSQQTSMKVSELLRRVALVYFPRTMIASLQDKAWLAFLNKTAKAVDFNLASECLLQAPYQRGTTIDLKPLFINAERWIRQRRKRCSN